MDAIGNLAYVLLDAVIAPSSTQMAQLLRLVIYGALAVLVGLSFIALLFMLYKGKWGKVKKLLLIAVGILDAAFGAWLLYSWQTFEFLMLSQFMQLAGWCFLFGGIVFVLGGIYVHYKNMKR